MLIRTKIEKVETCRNSQFVGADKINFIAFYIEILNVFK